MRHYSKTNRYTGAELVWDKVRRGAISIKGGSLPMLGVEVEVFTDMEVRGITKALGAAGQNSFEITEVQEVPIKMKGLDWENRHESEGVQ